MSADEQIVQLLADGSPQAMELLYDRYGRLAYTLALRVVGDASTAEDVVQEAFLSLWRQRAAYRAGRGSLRTWLCTIVHNRAVDRVRGRQGRARRDLPLEVAESNADERQDVAADATAALERERMRAALRALGEDQRRTLELAYFDGLSQTEIADRLSIPLGTVKGRTRLALAKLRTALGERDG